MRNWQVLDVAGRVASIEHGRGAVLFMGGPDGAPVDIGGSSRCTDVGACLQLSHSLARSLTFGASEVVPVCDAA